MERYRNIDVTLYVNNCLSFQERLRAIWNKYYSESHGVVFVIDSANEQRFQEAKETLRTR